MEKSCHAEHERRTGVSALPMNWVSLGRARRDGPRRIRLIRYWAGHKEKPIPLRNEWDGLDLFPIRRRSDQRSEVGAGPQRRALLMGTVKRVWVESEASIVTDLLNRSSAIF